MPCQVDATEPLNGATFGELRSTGIYDMQAVVKSPSGARPTAEREQYVVRMARPLLQVINDRLKLADQGSNLTISNSTQDTHGDTMEVAQLHSYIASARSLYARMRDGPTDAAFQGRSFCGDKRIWSALNMFISSA